jgi:hypothetical protein
MQTLPLERPLGGAPEAWVSAMKPGREALVEHSEARMLT